MDPFRKKRECCRPVSVGFRSQHGGLVALCAAIVLLQTLSPASAVAVGSGTGRHVVMVCGTGGFKQHDYSDIEYQLKRYHGLEAADYAATYGIDGLLGWPKLLLTAGLLWSTSDLDKPGTVSGDSKAAAHLSSIRLTATVAPMHVLTQSYLFFPYIGMFWENFRVRTRMGYLVRCVDCFLQDTRKYTVNGVGMVYGLAYYRRIGQVNMGRWPVALVLGVDTRVTVLLASESWKIDGHPVAYQGGADDHPGVPDFRGSGFVVTISLGVLLKSRQAKD